MKLKTLKDLKQGGKDDKRNFLVEFVNYEELKAEAIKWVKECEFNKKGWCPACEWITYFFNITEDSLSDIKQLNEKERAK